MATETEQTVLPNWRERLQSVGKQAFIQEEMERLGFWPPEEGVSEQMATAEAQLKILYAELNRAQTELRELDAEINKSRDIPALIQDIRKRRIERVRAARGEKKAEKARLAAEKAEADKAWRAQTLPFMGQGVSAGLIYEGGEAAKVADSGLPALATAEDLANAIGITTRQLAWLGYHRGATVADHYSRFTISKRSGGTRTISSPKPQLRIAQNWILANILTKIALHDAAMAFRPGRSIVDNARRHESKGFVLRMDLKDFFPSIGFRRVKGLFVSFGYNEGVASLLALLCTESPRLAASLDGERKWVAIDERSLPQGACTSPAITNILCRKLDSRLTGLARSFGATYTRYADDLVFSHEDKAFQGGRLFAAIGDIVAAEGYVLNSDKTLVMRPQHRQSVTGVVVNGTPRLSRRDIRNFRAFLHHCETEGLPAMTLKIGKSAAHYAAGYLAYMHMVNPEQAAKVQAAHGWLDRYRPAQSHE